MDRGIAKKEEARTRIELISTDLQSVVLPLNYRADLLRTIVIMVIIKLSSQCN